MAQKRYLFTPGPTPVPPEVLAALAEQVIHHRAPDFREVYARVLGRLKEVHRTSSEVLLFTCSGTGGFESAIVNLCSPGERVLAVSAGGVGGRGGGRGRTLAAATSRSFATRGARRPPRTISPASSGRSNPCRSSSSSIQRPRPGSS